MRSIWSCISHAVYAGFTAPESWSASLAYRRGIFGHTRYQCSWCALITGSTCCLHCKKFESVSFLDIECEKAENEEVVEGGGEDSAIVGPSSSRYQTRRRERERKKLKFVELWDLISLPDSFSYTVAFIEIWDLQSKLLTVSCQLSLDSLTTNFHTLISLNRVQYSHSTICNMSLGHY